MPSCYYCGCHLNNGEGTRRKVLTSEQARIYISKRGGGSYGQTYALRTLCLQCTSQLDARNQNLSWRLPTSMVIGFIGTIFAVRWAVSNDSNGAFQSLVFLFFLVGGAGFVAYFLLGLMSSQDASQINTDTQVHLTEEQTAQVDEPQESSDYPEYREVLQKIALECYDYGIAFMCCFIRQDEDEMGWFEVCDKILKNIPPKQFPSIEKWEEIVKKQAYKKFIEGIKDESRMKFVFEEIDEEDDEMYKIRLENAKQIVTKFLQQ